MEYKERMTAHEETTDKTTLLLQENTLKNEIKKAKEQAACLIIIRGTPQGHRFFLTQSEMVIGRDTEVEMSVADYGISRRHAKVIQKKDQFFITDLGSSNGTLVNDKKVPPGVDVLLAKEDMIKLGNTILKFLPAGELEIIFYGNLGSAAHTDPLTKIYNKGYLLEALEAEFKRAKALHTDFSLIFFDLDHFKKINDTYGHDAGDYVLKELTSLIRTDQLRPKDIFARYGGEEFVILLANTSVRGALELAERIRSSIQSHSFSYENQSLPVTISAGVSEIKSQIESAQALMKAADQALYAAKSAGRNQVMSAS